MRVVIDWTRCDGHGLCRALAPEHVGRDEWGYPLLPPDGHLPRPVARRLAAACPALALSVSATGPVPEGRRP